MLTTSCSVIPALGKRVRLRDGSIWVLVRVVKGKGLYAHWHKRARFEVIASPRFYRRGRHPQALGGFSHVFPRVISIAMYRFACISWRYGEPVSVVDAVGVEE
jgi:hypothetical protein